MPAHRRQLEASFAACRAERQASLPDNSQIGAFCHLSKLLQMVRCLTVQRGIRSDFCLETNSLRYASVSQRRLHPVGFLPLSKVLMGLSVLGRRPCFLARTKDYRFLSTSDYLFNVSPTLYFRNVATTTETR